MNDDGSRRSRSVLSSALLVACGHTPRYVICAICGSFPFLHPEVSCSLTTRPSCETLTTDHSNVIQRGDGPAAAYMFT